MSSLHLVCTESPYELDYFECGNEKIPALTRKNADFIEAIVHLDSNYGTDDDANEKPDSSFNPELHYSNSKGMKCGSTAYWFERMKKQNDNFDECLLGTIIAIDRTNSTHLEATIDGRREMRRIIKTVCTDVDSLRNELTRNYNQAPKDHLVGLMSVELPAKGKTGLRSNLSFASKFCSYASRYLDCDISYSKYDNVVSNHLAEYVFLYLDRIVDKKLIKYSSQIKNTFCNDGDKIGYITKIYQTYSDCIEEIICKLKTDFSTSLSKDELDHIIWYGFKGR